jgi:hypothetical protein
MKFNPERVGTGILASQMPIAQVAVKPFLLYVRK